MNRNTKKKNEQQKPKRHQIPFNKETFAPQKHARITYEWAQLQNMNKSTFFPIESSRIAHTNDLWSRKSIIVTLPHTHSRGITIRTYECKGQSLKILQDVEKERRKGTRKGVRERKIKGMGKSGLLHHLAKWRNRERGKRLFTPCVTVMTQATRGWPSAAKCVGLIAHTYTLKKKSDVEASSCSVVNLTCSLKRCLKEYLSL